MNVEKVATKPRVLFVDDEQPVLNSLKRYARFMHWEADVAGSGQEGLELIAENEYDVVISDMRMPKMNGAEFLAKVKQENPDSARILLTGYSDLHALEQAVNEAGIFNYLNKPWNEFVLQEVVDNAYEHVCNKRERARLEELTQNQNKKLGKLALLLDKQLKESKIETEQAQVILGNQHEILKHTAIDSLAIVTKIIEWNEGRDRGHTHFVEEYAVKLAQKIKMNEYDIEKLKIAAILHRIGVMGLPTEMRVRPTYSYDGEEKQLYQQYPAWGEMALSNSKSRLAEIGHIIRHHQEYVNGTGFPDQLIDNEIPMESKIICIVGDFFDAYNGRKERGISGLEAAMDYIKTWAGKRYDMGLVSAFLEIVVDYNSSDRTHIAINIDEVAPGDLIAEDILTKNGLLLLKAGSFVTKENLKSLNQYRDALNEDFAMIVKIDDQKEELKK